MISHWHYAVIKLLLTHKLDKGGQVIDVVIAMLLLLLKLRINIKQATRQETKYFSKIL